MVHGVPFVATRPATADVSYHSKCRTDQEPAMTSLRDLAPRSLDIVRRLRRRGAPAAVAVAALAACDAANAPAAHPPVTLSFSARPALVGAVADVRSLATRRSFDLQASDGAHTLVVGSVELVVDEIELQRAGVVAGCTDDSDDDSSGPGGSSDDCAELESGPQLIDLPLGDGGAPTVAAVVVPIPPGSYSELELELRPLDPGSGEDRSFLAAHPDLAGVTVRVRGTWDGAPFEYTTTLDDEIELDFSPPLEVAGSGVNITVNLDVLKWFHSADGTLIDPRTAVAGQPNASVVSANIRESLAVFEDDDHDGYDDHGRHGSDD